MKKEETEVLTVRVPAGTKQKLAAAAHARGTKPAPLVNAMLLALLNDDQAEAHRIEPIAGQMTMCRSEFWIPEFLRVALLRRAKEEGFKPARWVSLLVQANLMAGGVLTDDELFTVKESNRELAAIGRNINQIAKAINEEVAMGRSLSASGQVKMELIGKLQDRIECNRTAIDDLVIHRNQAWRVA
ncbi:plasmid mobilization relaxosome protein MobC [Acidovorax sp.]|uniref:plasmid mobilization relaxosome protein MobC n=1 Tax=Acidovorax sp. TaxID=1872122 RepID=UPI00391F66DD